MNPVIDIDGYPTDETVEFLSSYKNFTDVKEAMDFALKALEPERIQEKQICNSKRHSSIGYLHLSTNLSMVHICFYKMLFF